MTVERLELTHQKILDFESSASTSSATRALDFNTGLNFRIAFYCESPKVSKLSLIRNRYFFL